MNYCVDILNKAERGLEDDNLRGERRWERQVARALLDAGRCVGSVAEAWGRPDSPLWQGVFRPIGGAALITQADPGTVRYKPGASRFITNVFSVLLPSSEREIRQAISELGRRRVALTHSFQVHVPTKHLPYDLHDLVYWLPPPAIPRVHWDHDAFAKKTLLWSGRAIHLHLMSILKPVVDLLDWIRCALQEDPELTFEILCGEERIDQAGADHWIWRFEPFQAAFGDIRHRVKVHPSISWLEVQQIYARTKLVVNAPMTFGGPPIEAASYGIPVLGRHISSFHTADTSAPEPSHTAIPAFPEYRGIDAVGSLPLIDALDYWYRDETAYRQAGDAYRRYAHETYTHEAFVRHLDALPVFQ